jgi:uncharacterized LabA/DUF88 family protein
MADPTSLLFVDGTNLDHRLRAAFARDDVDFPAFFAAVTVGTDLQHVHYFSAPYIRSANPVSYKKQTADFNFLRTQRNVTLHLGRHQPRPVKCRSCNHRYTSYTEKGTDIFAAAKLVHAACHKEADRLILVTNDNDFWPALQLCRSNGVSVHVAFVINPNERVRDQLNRLSVLRKNTDRYRMLDKVLMDGCWRPPTAKKTSKTP